MDAAFSGGYDPALELAKQHTKKPPLDDFEYEGDSHEFYESEPWTLDIRRKEQDFVDAVVHGKEPGHYFMLLGPKVCFCFLFFCRGLSVVRALSGFRERFHGL